MATYSYTASKSAVVHLTTHLATDLIGDNILVNAIAPGYFPSNMTKEIVQDEAMTKYAITKIPVGRMGTAEDIAGAALYLSSRASAFVCGQTLIVDGGQIATD